MADKGKRMIFEDEYQYLKELIGAHGDPSAEWGGGGPETLDISDLINTTLSDEMYNYIITNKPILYKVQSSTDWYFKDYYIFSSNYDDPMTGQIQFDQIGGENFEIGTDSGIKSYNLRKRVPCIIISSDKYMTTSFYIVGTLVTVNWKYDLDYLLNNLTNSQFDQIINKNNYNTIVPVIATVTSGTTETSYEFTPIKWERTGDYQTGGSITLSLYCPAYPTTNWLNLEYINNNGQVTRTIALSSTPL